MLNPERGARVSVQRFKLMPLVSRVPTVLTLWSLAALCWAAGYDKLYVYDSPPWPPSGRRTPAQRAACVTLTLFGGVLE